MKEGEIWMTWDDLVDARDAGRLGPEWRPVELIWHGKFGSIRQPIGADLQGCTSTQTQTATST